MRSGLKKSVTGIILLLVAASALYLTVAFFRKPAPPEDTVETTAATEAITSDGSGMCAYLQDTLPLIETEGTGGYLRIEVTDPQDLQMIATMGLVVFVKEPDYVICAVDQEQYQQIASSGVLTVRAAQESDFKRREIVAYPKNPEEVQFVADTISDPWPSAPCPGEQTCVLLPGRAFDAQLTCLEERNIEYQLCSDEGCLPETEQALY